MGFLQWLLKKEKEKEKNTAAREGQDTLVASRRTPAKVYNMNNTDDTRIDHHNLHEKLVYIRQARRLIPRQPCLIGVVVSHSIHGHRETITYA